MKKYQLPLFIAVAVSTGSSPLLAEDASTIGEIFTKGDAGIAFRYRMETVDQDGIASNATASTLQSKLWFKTADYKGFSGFVEFTDTTAVGNETFNSTVNGNTTRPVVADPEVTELNQFYLGYKAKMGNITVGRRALNLDNQRFIGTVGFRQNDQTFDSVSGSFTPSKDLQANYNYIWNVNRIFGDDHPLGDLDSNTHLFNASYSGFSLGKLTAYGYLLDFNNASVLGLSSATVGVRFAGKSKATDTIKVSYEVEYANQRDYANSPLDYSANYWLASSGVSFKGFSIAIAYELLGSDDGVSFKTPLATLHKFNGWADKFLVTPAAGLQDVYASASYKVPGKGALSGTVIKAVYHDFQSDDGDLDYGSEWDFLISKKLNKNFTASIKAAFYNANTFATDTTKLWFTLGAKF